MIPAVALLLDGAALAVLALVPLAGPLGLADLEIPASAVAGWLIVGAPLALAAAALVGEIAPFAGGPFPRLVQWAFVSCLCAAALTFYMWAGADASELDDPERGRAFALLSTAIFAIDLLALWRPFAQSLEDSRSQRCTGR